MKHTDIIDKVLSTLREAVYECLVEYIWTYGDKGIVKLAVSVPLIFTLYDVAECYTYHIDKIELCDDGDIALYDGEKKAYVLDIEVESLIDFYHRILSQKKET